MRLSDIGKGDADIILHRIFVDSREEKSRVEKFGRRLVYSETGVV